MEDKALAIDILKHSKKLIDSTGQPTTIESLPGKAKKSNAGSYKVFMTNAVNATEIPENERVNYCFIYKNDTKIFNASWKNITQPTFHFMQHDWQTDFLSST